jgi:hypothetical protein
MGERGKRGKEKEALKEKGKKRKRESGREKGGKNG